MLAKELIQMIFKADGDVEYTVPDDALTVDLLEDGSYLKKAIEICNRNRTQMNMLKLMKILRDSWVWVPCNAVMSETDNDAVLKMIQEAEENGGLDKLVGKTITNQDSSQCSQQPRRWANMAKVSQKSRGISWKQLLSLGTTKRK